MRRCSRSTCRRHYPHLRALRWGGVSLEQISMQPCNVRLDLQMQPGTNGPPDECCTRPAGDARSPVASEPLECAKCKSRVNVWRPRGLLRCRRCTTSDTRAQGNRCTAPDSNLSSAALRMTPPASCVHLQPVKDQLAQWAWGADSAQWQWKHWQQVASSFAMILLPLVVPSCCLAPACRAHVLVHVHVHSHSQLQSHACVC